MFYVLRKSNLLKPGIFIDVADSQAICKAHLHDTVFTRSHIPLEDWYTHDFCNWKILLPGTESLSYSHNSVSVTDSECFYMCVCMYMREINFQQWVTEFSAKKINKKQRFQNQKILRFYKIFSGSSKGIPKWVLLQSLRPIP